MLHVFNPQLSNYYPCGGKLFHCKQSSVKYEIIPFLMPVNSECTPADVTKLSYERRGGNRCLLDILSSLQEKYCCQSTVRYLK